MNEGAKIKNEESKELVEAVESKFRKVVHKS